MKVTSNSTSCPETGPSPFVSWFGFGLMPFTTEFPTVKEPSGVAVKVRLGLTLSRLSNATSEGEFVRVGTFGIRPV